MKDVLQVRLGKQRAIAWQTFLKTTGLNQADVIRDAVDAKIKVPKKGLPPMAASLCGTVELPEMPPTNKNIARAFRS
jgi:hypothetical protein